MRRNNLLNQLSDLGFPMLAAEKTIDVNRALADMVKSRDLRFWEGFPVVLANGAEKGLLDLNKTKGYLKNTSEKSHFVLLVALSLALYNVLGLKFPWADKLCGSFSATGKKSFDDFTRKLKKDSEFKVGPCKMSGQRLKNTFNNYSAQEQSRLNNLLSVKEELNLEYALSQVFSPKQKELFLKRLKGEKLTKTEKEYFSRAVKKKVLALANSELHRLSRQLLEQ